MTIHRIQNELMFGIHKTQDVGDIDKMGIFIIMHHHRSHMRATIEPTQSMSKHCS